MKVCKIILVRHGESANNAAQIVGGDSPLTDKGKAQAQATKAALRHLDFDVVYSSNMQRAIQTAEAIAGREVPELNRLPELRERYFGEIEESPNHHHEIEHAQRLTLTDEENWHYKYVSDFESDHEVANRFIAALNKIAAHNLGKTILIVAHGATIRTSLMKLQGLGYKDFPQGSFKNAGYVELTSDGKQLQIEKIVSDSPLA